jgi:hypothetical protein
MGGREDISSLILTSLAISRYVCCGILLSTYQPIQPLVIVIPIQTTTQNAPSHSKNYITHPHPPPHRRTNEHAKSCGSYMVRLSGAEALECLGGGEMRFGCGWMGGVGGMVLSVLCCCRWVLVTGGVCHCCILTSYSSYPPFLTAILYTPHYV